MEYTILDVGTSPARPVAQRGSSRGARGGTGPGVSARAGPHRGRDRIYSEADTVVLRRIREPLGEALNLAGIRLVVELEAENARVRAKLTTARR